MHARVECTHNLHTTARLKVTHHNNCAQLRSVTRGLAGHFDSRRFPMGHAPTNFKQWFGSNFGFQVTYAYR